MHRSVHPIYPRAAFEVPKAPSRLERKGANAPANESSPLSLSLSLLPCRPHCSVAKGRFTNRRRCGVPLSLSLSLTLFSAVPIPSSRVLRRPSRRLPWPWIDLLHQGENLGTLR